MSYESGKPTLMKYSPASNFTGQATDNRQPTTEKISTGILEFLCEYHENPNEYHQNPSE
jgi:hypothetical protein